MIFGRHINKYYLKRLPMLLLGILTLVIIDIFQLYIPEIYRLMINGLTTGQADGRPFDMDLLLNGICLPMLVIILVMVVGRFVWRICFFGSAIRSVTELRSEMFSRAKWLSQSYYQRNKVGGMMSLFTNDIDTIRECFGDGILMLFDALALGSIAVIKMARMNPTLTLLSMIPMAFLLVVGSIVGRSMKAKWARRQEAFSSMSDFAQESFSGIAVVKAFVKELRELLAFRKINRENEEANVAYTRTSTLLHVCVTLFVESVVCVILGYGGYLVYRGGFDGGQLVEFIGYFTSVVWPVMALSGLIDLTSRGNASLRRISDLLDSAPEVVDREGATELVSAKGAIEFKNLTFRYKGAGYDALKEVSFRIEAGERVGIIGKTGSGKTTLVDLILRIYNVEDGTLFIDGEDVNRLTISSVRAAIAYVPQDNFLFSDTIEINIAFASDTPCREDVIRAATLSDVHSNIVEFTDGYDTVLGERGVTVSGGQKQRISIARALMKNAPILILDDSISAVDTGTEERILSNLERERKGKTTLLIAHRVSTVRGMDKILFIDEGKILAMGTHDELMESSPEYRNTVLLQKLDDEGGDE